MNERDRIKIGEEIINVLTKYDITPFEQIALLETLKLTIYAVIAKK